MRRIFEALNNTLDRFGKRRAKTAGRVRPHGAHSLRIEPLERRELLSLTPTIGSVWLCRDLYHTGNTVMLSANDVTDSNGHVADVSFYRVEGSGLSLIGTDTNGSDGWTATLAAADQLAGPSKFMAKATDGVHCLGIAFSGVYQGILPQTGANEASGSLSTGERLSGSTGASLMSRESGGMSLMSQNGRAAGITISAVASVDEGSPYTLDLSPSGDDAADITGWQINWGDGHVDNITGHPATATHHYADGPADYRISATATDGTNSFGSDGELDASFFDGGVRSTQIAGFPYYAQAAILPDGNVVMLDSWGLQTTNGATVNLWSYFGYMPGTEKIAVEPDGKILVSGVGKDGKMNVVRFLENGDLDTSFGANHDGIASTAFDAFLNYYNGDYGYTIYGWNSASLAVAQDGSFVVSSSLTGTDVSLQHFSADGILDTDFGGNENGIASADLSDSSYWNNVENRVFIAPDGQILAGGNFYDSYYYMSTWRFAEFDASGLRDTGAFGGSGVLNVGSYVKDMAFLSDGSIIATDGSAVTHYVDVAQDMDFGSGGSIAGSAIAVQADGKLLILQSVSDSYTSTLYLDRYNADLTVDAYFGGDGRVQTNLGYDDGLQVPLALAVQADGKILIASYEYEYGYPADGNLLVGRFDSGLAVHVDNAAPTLSVAGSISVKVGQTLDLTSLATFTDPGFDDPEALPPTSEYFTYTITWGDGQTDDDMWVDNVTPGSQGVATHGAIDAQHVFDEPDTYHASLTFADDDGDAHTVDFDITVIKPSIVISDNNVPDENSAHSVSLGDTYTLTLGAVNDPGGDAVQSYTVNWGDGLWDIIQADQMPQNNQVTHVYENKPGLAAITVDVTDDGGTYTDTAESFTVDVNPLVSSLTNLNFNDASDNIIHVANFGAAAADGSFQIGVPYELQYELTSNLDMAGNATVKWQASDPSQPPADFQMSATCSYNGETWSRTYSVHFASQGLAPMFAQSGDQNYWGGNEIIAPSGDGSRGYETSFAANHKLGDTLTYSIVDPLDAPADAALDPDTAEFTCTFSTGDAYRVYEFDIRAQGSAGYDIMHVVLPVYLQFKGQAAAVKDVSAYTDVYAAGYQPLSVWLGPGESLPNGVLHIVDGPEHGSLSTGGGGSSGEVFYTPGAGFRGVDHFTYYWQYDLYDVGGNLVQAGVSTNTATAYVQVGQMCNVDASSMTQVDDKYVLGAEQSATLMLNLEDPRMDGVPVTGVWSLDYEPSLLKVTTAGGAEVLPGKLNYESGMTQSKQVTLTVTGVSGGAVNLTAHWSILTDPSGYPNQRFGTGGGETVGISLVTARIEMPSQILAVHEEGYHDLVGGTVGVFGISLPTAPNQVVGQLKVTGGIRVWGDQGMTIPIASSGNAAAIDFFYGATLSESIYIEAVMPGKATLEWSAKVNGEESNKDVVEFTLLKLNSLTVIDHAHPSSTVTVTDNTPGGLCVQADKNGNVSLDIKAAFAPTGEGKHVLYEISQGDKAIAGHFTAAGTLSRTFKAADGNIAIMVAVDNAGNSQ
jgi:uncharacterized delta-60 repeat protein